MILRCLHHQTWSEVQEMKNEFIGMLGLNVEFLEGLWRKIRQIARDDHAGTALDCGCQHVTIIPVW